MSDYMSPHFRRAELECKCGCGEASMQDLLLKRLEALRDHYGSPITITSGFRCAGHNAHVGGAPQSAHLHGCAVDMQCGTGRERWLLVGAAIAAGFNRIGIAGDFVHVDCHPEKSPRVIWSY